MKPDADTTTTQPEPDACPNCGVQSPLSLIHPLLTCRHLAERLHPGDVVPLGECPTCGALVSALIKPEITAAQLAECLRALAEECDAYVNSDDAELPDHGSAIALLEKYDAQAAH